MLAVFFYRRSFFLLCIFVLLYCVFVLLHTPFQPVNTVWHTRLLPHFGSHSPHSQILTSSLNTDSHSHDGVPRPHSPILDDKDFESKVPTPAYAQDAYSSAQLRPSATTATEPTASVVTSSAVSAEAEHTTLADSLPSTSTPEAHSQTSGSAQTMVSPEPVQASSVKHCSELPGADDVMIAMKTGESELKDKLPVHFTTTFACAKHFAIFSDVDREFHGHHVKDVLAGIPIEIRRDKYEFKFYNRLHESVSEGAEDLEPLKDGAAMKEENPAWILDKWKFLPIVEQAYEHKPDAKWFVFIEADATVVWWNLLGWLSKFDHNEPYYLGRPAWAGDTEFGHGGAGYVLSQTAVRKLVTALREDPRRYDRVSQECCGDFVVAMALRELIDLKLLTSWPSIQGETPTTIDYIAHHWCHPAITYHHMNATQIRDMWEFEQAWERAHAAQGPGLTPLTHRDVFTHFVWPHIQEERDNWDNMSTDVEITPASAGEHEHLTTAHHSADACRDGCVRTLDCVQWSWEPTTCRLQFAARLGDATPAQRPLGEGMRAGWNTQRIADLRREREGCEPIWITSRADV